MVLELVSHYVPASEDEVYDFLNALEDRMTHTNSVREGKGGDAHQLGKGGQYEGAEQRQIKVLVCVRGEVCVIRV